MPIDSRDPLFMVHDFFEPLRELWCCLYMNKRNLILAALLVAVVAVSVHAKDVWTSVHSRNFVLVGNASEKDIKQVAVRLEQFREVFTHLFPGMNFNSPVPTTVIVFKNDSSYRPFKSNPNLAGYFQPGPDVNYITLTTEVRGEQDPFNVIFHEYTHLLVNNTIGNAPVWFNEGLAEYYSTFSITDDRKVVLGKPIANHVFLLRDNRMLPLRTLFQVDYKSPYYNERNKQSIFYAESWALVHYLLIGKEGRLEQLGKFVELLRAKLPMEVAFHQSFQISIETMEKELHDYVRQDRYRVMEGHFERKLETDAALQTVPITEADAQAYLGDLLLHIYRKDCETYLLKAIELDPQQSLAHAALGVSRLRDGKQAEALRNLEQAVAADSQNYLVHYYYAYVLSRPNTDQSQPINGFAPEVASKIRDELLKAIQLRPDFPESYGLLAFVSVVTGQNLDESLALVKRAVANSPGRNDLIFMLGQLHLRKGDYVEARQLFEQVTTSNVTEEVRQQAESLLAEVVSFQQQQEKQEKPEAEKQTRASTNDETLGPIADEKPSAPSAADQSNYLREVLRAPVTGEKQLQGVLLRIDCDAKGITVVVKVGEQTLKFRARDFDEVEITTYSADVKGQITCGVRKVEESVVICFVPQPDKRLGVDGMLKSVEFVPRDFKLKA